MLAAGVCGQRFVYFRVDEQGRVPPGDWDAVVPVLSDPATLGCLVNVVRAAYHDYSLCTRSLCSIDAMGDWTTGPWCVYSTSNHTQIRVSEGPTEADALVAALEAS